MSMKIHLTFKIEKKKKTFVSSNNKANPGK